MDDKVWSNERKFEFSGSPFESVRVSKWRFDAYTVSMLFSMYAPFEWDVKLLQTFSGDLMVIEFLFWVFGGNLELS